MSDFTINCPHCQQGITVTPAHVGLEIACPTCQKNLVVPQNPAAPAPKAGTRLSGVPSAAPTSTPPPPPGMQMGRPTKKPKKRMGVILGVCGSIAFVVAFIFAWPLIMKGIKSASPETVVVTNAAPPPPPPELTTEEIMAKVEDAYKNLSDFSARVQTSAELHVPGPKRTTNTITTSSIGILEMVHSNYYRLEWNESVAGKHLEGAAWDSGKGDFVKIGAGGPNKVKTREAATAPAEAAMVLSPFVMEVFFNTTNSFTRNPSMFTRTNASDISQFSDYGLIGEYDHQTVLVGVRKDTFLIERIMLILTGEVDESELKKLPSAERAQLSALARIKGTVTEDYSDIKVNQNLLVGTLDAPIEKNVPKAAPNRGAVSQRPTSQAGQLVAPIRRRQQQAQQQNGQP